MALSHLDQDGRARMVDVGEKAVTARVAVVRPPLPPLAPPPCAPLRTNVACVTPRGTVHV